MCVVGVYGACACHCVLTCMFVCACMIVVNATSCRFRLVSRGTRCHLRRYNSFTRILDNALESSVDAYTSRFQLIYTFIDQTEKRNRAIVKLTRLLVHTSTINVNSAVPPPRVGHSVSIVIIIYYNDPLWTWLSRSPFMKHQWQLLASHKCIGVSRRVNYYFK